MKKFLKVLGVVAEEVSELKKVDGVCSVITTYYKIKAEELNEVLSKAMFVYGARDSADAMILMKTPCAEYDTHTGYVLNLQEIKKEPIKKTMVISRRNYLGTVDVPGELLGRKFKVTFEEVGEE